MLLCQMVVGEKLATDPVAQRLFDNMLAYCDALRAGAEEHGRGDGPEEPGREAAGRCGPEVRRGRRRARGHRPTASTRSSSSTPRRPTSRPWPAAGDQVKAFTAKGGWLMAWGLTPEGLADFNRLVGVRARDPALRAGAGQPAGRARSAAFRA